MESGCNSAPGSGGTGGRLVHVVPTSLLHEKFESALGGGSLLDLHAHQFSIELLADVRY